MDSATSVNGGKGFSAIDTINKQTTGSGIIDATVAEDEAAPEVILTTDDPFNQHASEGGYSSSIGSADPYQSTGAPGNMGSGIPLKGGSK